MSGAAGYYALRLTGGAGVATDLMIQPGQNVHIICDLGLDAAPSWGSGGFTVRERGSLSVVGVALESTMTMEAGGTLLRLHNCVINGINTDTLNLPSNVMGVLPSPSTNPNGKAFVIFLLPLVD
eukprot:SAG25_NODE_6201_length_579_cov_1.400000_1_plen_123_part_01